MFCYKEDQNVTRLHGCFEGKIVDWIKAHQEGIAAQAAFSFELIHSGFCVQARIPRITLFAIAMEQLSICEQLAILMHEMQGSDAQYLDHEEESIPQQICIDDDHDEKNLQVKLADNYELLLMNSRQHIKQITAFFKEASRLVTEKNNRILFEALHQRELDLLWGIQHLMQQEHPETHPFQLSADQLFDARASNYFDEPNPRFFTKREIELESRSALTPDEKREG